MIFYRVIDNQQTGFMGDTHKKPITLNGLRARFWSLDENRTDKYKNFTSDYIQEVWGVSFERIIK